MIELLVSPEAWISFATLTVLEIVLGIDNIIFISILVGRLPPGERARARRIGLGLALVSRIALLFAITWVMGLTADLFTVLDQGISGRDLILLGGGAFLLAKATLEIHASLEGAEEHRDGGAAAGVLAVVMQIAVIDIVFSLDSVITAVGLAEHVEIMVAAIVVAVAVMMVAAAPIGEFVDAHPTIKMLALSFLMLVGVALIADGLDVHIPRGYIYFAMAFATVVELLNLRVRRSGAPLRLHKPLTEEQKFVRGEN